MYRHRSAYHASGMTALVQAVLRARRTARLAWGLGVAFLLAAFLLAGFFLPGFGAYGGLHLAWVLVWALLFSARVRSAAKRGLDARLGIELGVLLLVGVHALVQFGGGLQSEWYPLTYVAIAFVASFTTGWVGLAVVGFAVALDAGIYFLAEGRTSSAPFAIHAAYIVGFGALNLVFTRAEIARVRLRSEREMAAQQARVRDETRLFRLVAPSSDGLRDEERLFQSSVEEVHQALRHTLDLFHRTLELHTCVLLIPSADAEQLRITELVTHSDDIADGPFAIGAGAVGATVKRKMVTNLQHVRAGYRGICYYAGPSIVRSFIAVPVLEGEHLRGVLCADRLIDRPFNEREEALLQQSTAHLLRAFENERVFLALQNSKREQDVLYRASQALGTALDKNAVMDAGLAAAMEIAPYDFAAITAYLPAERRHVIERADGEQAEDFQGLRFRDNSSLTAMVVKNRHYLPYRGEFDPKQMVVFTKRANLKRMSSLLVLPLIVREEPIGTLLLATKKQHAFSRSVRGTLGVLANQLALSIANAQAVRRLEEAATTDGLTGCLNKRAFIDEMEQKLTAARRFGRKLSLIVTDLDHFKAVNDTYGHATGDRVLQELGRVLREVKRETDVVARFGGEEFCVLCEETDMGGAKLLAERVRQQLELTQLPTELGSLKITASLGVATFPDHAADAAALFEQGDRALYEAKRRGRNQVRTAGPQSS